MTLFWALASGLVLIVPLAVIVPLWMQRRQHDRLSQEAINASIFKERETELDNDLAEGRIDTDQHAQLRLELERTLLDDMATATPSARASGGRWLASGVTLLIVAVAVGYYYQFTYRGETDAWLQVQSELGPLVEQAVRRPNDLPDAAYDNLFEFTRVLQARALREGKRNPDTLFLLGTTFIQLRAYDTARELLQRAHEQAPLRDDILLAQAQAEIMQADGRLTDTSRRQLHTVLQRQPDNRGALMLLGFAAFNSGEYAQAADAWLQLREQVTPGTDVDRLLADNIARAEAMINRTGSAEPPDAPARIDVTVDLAPELREQLLPEDTLFIFARAMSGPPLPLAAVRHPATDFPISVVLDDSNAMLPEMTLSDFPDIVVSARISRSGDATASPGDLEGISDPLDLRNGPLSVQLTVDRVIQ